MPEDTSPRRAKLFWNGRSQAVRLPKDFRFSGDEVEIRRVGDAVVLAPLRKQSWPDGYWEWIDRHREDLELDTVEPLGAGLLEPDLEDP